MHYTRELKVEIQQFDVFQPTLPSCFPQVPPWSCCEPLKIKKNKNNNNHSHQLQSDMIKA